MYFDTSPFRKDIHNVANPDFIVCLAPRPRHDYPDRSLLSIICHLSTSLRAKRWSVPEPNLKAQPTMDVCFSVNLHGDGYLSDVCRSKLFRRGRFRQPVGSIDADQAFANRRHDRNRLRLQRTLTGGTDDELE